MPKHPHSLPTRVRRRRKGNPGTGTPLLRQWKLLEQLSSSAKGATVYELAGSLGVDVKTIRRDLILFKQVGFDVAETVEEFGRKVWRIRHSFDALRSRQRQYRSIRNSLALLVEQAQTVGDHRLVADLEMVRKKVARKGR